ncbi:substrate-binding domain-containing protein [Salinarimonas ramus]|uniref:Ribose ABC transporter substrate-binding protein n=1 Tax=Salinarimonas ramus TaxID=690164 RepID=A0A917V5F1_9HYPH|nr:substrate-binding domain-containing protein [Salinarimonas ramus]GGK40280.1 ribose ABC transporter substrate-binding protein [Salinarimonas ramus]
MRKLAITALAATGVAFGGAAMAQDQDYTIGVSIPAATHGWTGGVVFHAEQAAQTLEEGYPGLNVIVQTSPDAPSQASAIEDLAAQGIDALVVLPFNSDELTGPVGALAGRNPDLFVTVVDRGLSDPSIQDLYVAGDNPGFGRVAAEYFVERLEDGAQVVVLRGIPTVIDDERNESFRAALDGSGIEIVDSQYANWNRDDAFRVMQDFLSKHDRIDAVWASDDDMALGVIEAIRQAEREDIQFVVGGAGMKQMVQRVMEGDPMIPVDVSYPPGMIATAMAVTAGSFYSQAPVRGTYVLDAELITQENAERFYFEDSPF